MNTLKIEEIVTLKKIITNNDLNSKENMENFGLNGATR